MAQRLETARAFVVVLQQESLELCIAKNLCDRAIVAGGVKLALIISAAKVQAERDAGMITDHRIVHFDRQIQQPVGIVAPLPIALPQIGIQQRSVLR